MKTIHVKRCITIIDDRSPKYLVINDNVKGKIHTSVDNTFRTEEEQAKVFIKDFIGIRSNILSLNEDKEYYIEYKLNNAWLICTSLMLFLTFIYIAVMEMPSIRQQITSPLISVALAAGVWVLYIAFTLICLKNRLYILREEL